MKITPVERIRHAICALLSKLCSEPVASLHETILIRDGLYCGRKFQIPGYEVVWFVEEDEIKVFGPCGNLLSTNSAITVLNELDTENQQQLTPTRRVA
jgi:hypothetical protein